MMDDCGAVPSSFAHWIDAQEYLQRRTGTHYLRDDPETLDIAERLGIRRQVEHAIDLSRALDSEIDASVRRASATTASTRGSLRPISLRVVWLDQAALDEERRPLIKGFIDQRSLIVVYGPTGQGKTFFVA